MTSPIVDSSALWRQWAAAAVDPSIDGVIQALYADIDRQVQARGPVCFASGRCCNFDAYGHRLYVTGLEIAWVGIQSFKFQVSGSKTLQGLHGDEVESGGAVRLAEKPPEGCPFQIGKLCGVHAVRPLGCRVFFCQEGTRQWQQDLYEQFLASLRQLHGKWDIEYRYLEWRAGLADMIRTLGWPLPRSTPVALSPAVPAVQADGGQSP
jgi:Fe-S-cluster containining protein